MIEAADAQVAAEGPTGPVGLDDAGDEQLLRQLAGRAAVGGLSLAGEAAFRTRSKRKGPDEFDVEPEWATEAVMARRQ